MTSRSAKDAIVLAMDCSRGMAAPCLTTNGSTNDNTSTSAYELSRKCLQYIIRQKIFAETKNEYLLMEFGIGDGSNGQQSDNIVGPQMDGHLYRPTFELLRHLNKANPTHLVSNPSKLMDVLDKAIHLLMSQVTGKANLKIVLLTNFANFDDNDMNQYGQSTINKLNQYSIQLIVVCDFTPTNYKGLELSKSQVKAVEWMEMVEKKGNGFHYDLQCAIKQFGQFELKETSSNVQYCKLELGQRIIGKGDDRKINSNALNISIAFVIKTYPISKPKFKAIYVKPISSGMPSVNNKPIEDIDMKPVIVESSQPVNEVPVKRETTFVDQNNEPVTKDDLTYAYTYGQTLVPFSVEDKEQFNYRNNEEGFKGYKILLFTSVANIHKDQRMGQRMYYIYPDPRPKQNGHKLVFQSLVSALMDKNCVAIVRYNFSDKSGPQIGYLEPLIENGNVLLAYYQLPFAEDIRHYKLPSLESKSKYKPTEEQLEAIDGLIDAMDLMGADIDDEGEVCDALQWEEINDPSSRYVLQVMYDQHMHALSQSKVKSQIQMSDYLKTIDAPLAVRQKSAKALQMIADKFSLELSTKLLAKRKKSASDVNQTPNHSESDAKRARIGEEMNEVDIFKREISTMINDSVDFNLITNKFDYSLKVLFSDTKTLEVLGEDIIELIALYREESVKNGSAEAFNHFMLTLMNDFRGQHIWYLLLSKDLTLVPKTECPDSQVTQEMVDNYTNISD